MGDRTRRELAQNAMKLLRESGALDSESGDCAMSILTQVDLKKHARYRFGDFGEFLVKYRKYYSRSADTQPVRSDAATTGAQERLTLKLDRSSAGRSQYGK